MINEQTPVLVVGGSMVGLAAAMFLAQQGIRPLMVERHAEISTHPRAQAVSPRTMEILRAMGLEEAVRAAETVHARYGNILQVESLAGQEFGWFDGPFRHDKYRASTTGWTLIGQDRLEPILRAHAERLGADIRFATELVGYQQDVDGITATLCDLRSGTEVVVRASYLIAADGHRSALRQSLHIGTHGPGTFGRQMNVLFRADLRKHVRDREFFLCFVNNPAVHGVLGQLGASGDRWVLAPSLRSEDDYRDYSEQRCMELVRAAVGDPALRVTIETSTSWEIAAEIADSFRQGRVFLAGDAAHVMPPTGGFGGNLGLQDAHNLAWKLAHVLRASAGPALLDSYQQERMPVAEFTVDQGVLRYLQRSGLDQDAASRHQPESTVLFGQRYRSSAVLAEDVDNPDGPVFEDPLQPSGRPGTRAPHLWLLREGVPIGVHDLIRGEFVLLTGSAGDAWLAAAAELSAHHEVTVRGYLIGGAHLRDVDNSLSIKYGITPGGAVLIRPDGFIAWRSATLLAHPVTALLSALDRVLHQDRSSSWQCAQRTLGAAIDHSA